MGPSSSSERYQVSILSHVLWANGCMDQDATWYGVRPRPRPYCVTWGPSSPLKKRHSSPPNFLTVCCGQTAGWIKMRLRTEVDLGPGHIVLDGAQLLLGKGHSPLVRMCGRGLPTHQIRWKSEKLFVDVRTDTPEFQSTRSSVGDDLKTRKPCKGAAVIAASMHGFANCRKFKRPVILTLILDRVKDMSTYTARVGLQACPTM